MVFSEPTKTIDYRKWLVFNEGLNNNQNLYDLYQAVNGACRVGESECLPINSEENKRYRIFSSKNYDILEVTETERIELLSYLKSHYFLTDDIENWYREKKGSQNNNSFIAHSETLNTKQVDALPIPVRGSRIFNKNVYKQALHFSLIAFALMQLIIIPEHLLNIDIPQSVIKVYSFGLFFLLGFISSRIYCRDYMTLARYGPIFRLTVSFITLTYIWSGIETAIFDIIRGKFGLLTQSLVLFIEVFIGIFIGIVFTPIFYAINRGKVVTNASGRDLGKI